MQPVSILIKNVRSFLNLNIQISSLSLVTGQNNAGKSSLIDAIRLFYGELKWQPDRDLPYNKECSDSWVEIHFKLTKTELSEFPDVYDVSDDNIFRIRRIFEGAKTGMFSYKQGVLSESSFFGAKNVQSAKLGKIVYIPAVSRLDDHTKLSGPSALKDLLELALKEPTINEAHAELEKAFLAYQEVVHVAGQSNASFQEKLSEELHSWKVRFETSVEPVSSASLMKSAMSLGVIEEGSNDVRDPGSLGAGFQRQLAFALIKIRGDQKNNKVEKNTKSFDPEMLWLLFEEPEAFLHPVQIELLAVSLRKMSQSEGSPVLITTHNPHFAAKNVQDLPAFIRLQRKNGNTEAFTTKDMNLLDGLTNNRATDAVKLAIWLDPRRTAALFASRVLLVEGESESAVFPYLVDSGVLRVGVDGTCIIDVGSKTAFPPYMKLFGELGIEHGVLYDADPMHKDTPSVAKKIADAFNEKTLGVEVLSPDLEGFFNWPEKIKGWGKPTWALKQVVAKNYTIEQIRQLQRLVDNCLGGPRL